MPHASTWRFVVLGLAIWLLISGGTVVVPAAASVTSGTSDPVCITVTSSFTLDVADLNLDPVDSTIETAGACLSECPEGVATSTSDTTVCGFTLASCPGGITTVSETFTSACGLHVRTCATAGIVVDCHALGTGDFPEPFPVTPASASDLNPSVCWNAQGTWEIPNGLVVGGPEDNTASEPYRSWTSNCPLTMSTGATTIYRPFADVMQDWLKCLGEPATGASTSGPPSGFSPDSPDPATQAAALIGEDGCGPPPDATAVLPDGTLPIDVPYVELGSGSIAFASYIYSSGGSKKDDPLNVVFYDHGYADNVKTVMTWTPPSGPDWFRVGGHWHAESAGVYCATDHQAYIWDARHGGTDHWEWSTWQLEHDHGSKCYSARQHIRLYGNGVYDNHCPGCFQHYGLGPVHWDNAAHSAVNHNSGRTHKLAEFDAGGYWWVGARSKYYAGNTACASSCGTHDGYIVLQRINP